MNSAFVGRVLSARVLGVLEGEDTLEFTDMRQVEDLPDTLQAAHVHVF